MIPNFDITPCIVSRDIFEFIRQPRAIILHTSFHILNLGIKTMKEILIPRSLLLFFFSFFRIESSFTIAWTRLNLFRDSKGKKRKKRTDVIALLRISNSVGYCLERSFQYSKPLFEIQDGIIVSKFQRHPIHFSRKMSPFCETSFAGSYPFSFRSDLEFCPSSALLRILPRVFLDNNLPRETLPFFRGKRTREEMVNKISTR